MSVCCRQISQNDDHSPMYEQDYRRSFFGGAISVIFMIFIVCCSFTFIAILTNELTIYNYEQGFRSGMKAGLNSGEDSGYAEGFQVGHSSGMLEMMQLIEGNKLRKELQHLEKSLPGKSITKDSFIYEDISK